MVKNAELLFSGRKSLVYLLKSEYVFLFKTGRDIDIDDCRILAEHGLDRKSILEEVVSQQTRMKKVIGLTLLDVLDELKNRFSISSPITRKLDSVVLE